MEEIFYMSNKELERFNILTAVKNKQLTQIKGAQLLDLSTRQVRNLLYQLNTIGPKGLISKKRGKASNRKYKSQFKKNILKLIKHRYEDFGPSFISEKLKEKHEIIISAETIRSWMMEVHLWIPKQRKRNRHPLRKRKECFGELIQIDGSHHDWFEGRAAPCVLIVFIDDATSKLTSLHFAPSESLEAYFDALEIHLNRYGIPQSIYSDRFRVFESQKGEEALTQFKFALKTLDILHFTAKTPQAKGRVERVNQTLQDRLIKEMRLKNVSTIEEANQFCKEYMEIHNHKFSKGPANNFDTHRPLEIDLSRILCRYEERTLSNDLSISFHNKTYQIYKAKDFFLPKKAKIEVRKQRNGQLRFFFKDCELNYIPYDQLPYNKHYGLKDWALTKKGSIPKVSHPWKNKSYKEYLKREEMKKVI